MNKYILTIEIIYLIVIAIVCMRIIYDTRSPSKSLAYILSVIFIPILGILFYFTFGVNYRKRSIYSKKLLADEEKFKDFNKVIISHDDDNNITLNTDVINSEDILIKLLANDNSSPLTIGNEVKILVNGEEKFPELIEAIKLAKHHIHLEYYIYEDSIIGNTLKNILINKAKEGVKIRLIYDDFGSKSIRKKIVKELRAGGVEAYPFNRIRLLFFANRINYRNHRKIIVIDGKTGFTGGINISDRYINNAQDNSKKFWRDTHIRIDGPGVMMLQHIFLCDWNFCSNQQIKAQLELFNAPSSNNSNVKIQIASSGPDSPNSTIMLSLLKAITMAKKEILITTPYFIPGGSIIDGLKLAALGGVSVKLIVPGISDSKIVNAAAYTYYGELMRSGVEIYRYYKGFIHAKTMIIDESFSIIGTANMNHRSFNLDFEVNANIYDAEVSKKLRHLFYEDLKYSKKISLMQWIERPFRVKLAERIARLFSPMF